MRTRLLGFTTVSALLTAVSPLAHAQQQAQPAVRTRPSGDTRLARRRQPPPPAPTPAPRQEDPTVVEAREAYNEGSRLIAAEQFEQALVQYQRAFTLRSNPVVLVPIAQCQERLGQIPAAITTLERYLRDRPDATDRAQVEARLADLRARPATVTLRLTPATASVSIDGAAATPNASGELTVPPGEHQVTITASGFQTSTQPLTTTPGARQDLVAELTAVPPPPPTPALTPPPPSEPVAPPRRGVHPVVFVAGGLAAAGLVAGSVFGFLSLSDRAEYDAMPSADVRDRGMRNAMFSDVFFGTAILSAGVALVVALTGNQAPAASSPRASMFHRPRQAVTVMPGGAGLTISF